MRNLLRSLRGASRVALLATALPVMFMLAAGVARPAEAAPERQPVAPTASIYPTGATGYDVSWPNCSAKPPAHPPFGIVGVNDGTGYSQNPCLAQEAAWFPALSLYANTGWYNQSSHINPNSPKVCASGDNNCLAYNYGYNAGLYALNYANSQNLHASVWWLDVETGNTWNADTTQNRNSLQGEYDALIANGVTTVGVYSTTYQWDTITGTWLNNWPNWGATTVHTASQAAKFCTGHQFTGGPTYLIQFTGSLDQDYAC
ncbi:MAG TPA: hypothetical protein VF808_07580 [Ktedonobacterales bacterium]